jgi:hypothetical protein
MRWQAEEVEEVEGVCVEDVSVTTPMADVTEAEVEVEVEAEIEAEQQGEAEAPVTELPTAEEDVSVSTDAVNVDGRIVVIEEESDA